VQFEKLEQFCITEPEKSWEMHEEMCKNAEEFLQSVRVIIALSSRDGRHSTAVTVTCGDICA
jgi:hypothetical protein